MLYKNLPDGRLNRVLLLRLVLDYVAALKFLLERKPKEFQAVFQAHRDYRRRKPGLRLKREALRPRQVSCIYRGHLLLDFYLRGKKHFSTLETSNLSNQ